MLLAGPGKVLGGCKLREVHMNLGSLDEALDGCSAQVTAASSDLGSELELLKSSKPKCSFLGPNLLY